MRNLGLDALVKASRTANAPSEDVRARNRSRLAGQIAAGMGATSLASAALEPSSTLAGGVAKWAVVSILIALGGVTGAGVYVTRGHFSKLPTPPTVVAPVSRGEAAQPTLASGPVTSPPTAAPVEVSTAPEAHSPRGPASPHALAVSRPGGESRARQVPSVGLGSSTPGGQSFERELQLLRSARRALDADSPVQALALLDRYAAEFPRGALRPEYEAARVLALCAAGRVAAARQARDQFLKEQPGSPLADGLRASCAGER
jgi:hypothetical protein